LSQLKIIEKAMQKQKNILNRISSTALAIFFLLLAGVQTAVGAGWNKSDYTSVGLPYSSSLSDIIKNIANWLLGIFGFIAVVGFVVSGIMYLTAAGDEDAQERAKRAMYYSITGVLVGLVGLIVIYAVDNLLRASSSI
jgi:cytochrome bd-type quinol oxidase subunit 2